MTVGDELLVPEIQQELSAADPNIERLWNLVVQAFNREEQERLNPSALSEVDRERVAGYLNQALIHNEQFAGLAGKYLVLRFVLFADLAGKLNWLAQAPCLICSTGVGFPISIFNVRVSPQSRQAQLARLRRAFERAIAVGIKGKGLHQYRDTPLCVRIVYLVAATRPQNLDVDNLTKGTLDALREVLGDDRQVAHLDLVKIRHPGDDEYFVVRAQSTQINQHERDTFEQEFRVRWMQEKLELEDFLEE